VLNGSAKIVLAFLFANANSKISHFFSKKMKIMVDGATHLVGNRYWYSRAFIQHAQTRPYAIFGLARQVWIAYSLE
jgi:hypothetical protein